MKLKAPIVLIIMDGWGLRKEKEGNAIALADTPNFDTLWKNYPHCQLEASGKAVGLLEGMFGNSETGHLNIGAGRIVKEDVIRISDAIADGKFFQNKALLKAIAHVLKNKSNLHIMGLLSDAGVHAYDVHLYALLKLCHDHGVKPILHIFTDGRDTPIKSALHYLAKLKEQLTKFPAVIATISGRFYAMDRDRRWDRTEKAYLAIAEGKGRKAKTPEEAIKKAYQNNETDEFITPTVVANYKGVKDNDAIIFFNFRYDRARQLTKAFVEKYFDGFDRIKQKKVLFVAMTEYYPNMPALIAFRKLKLRNILGEVISKNNLLQLRVAETEKYAHVTFFFNGQRERPFKGEDRILIPSPKVKTYDLKPEMSAFAVKDAVIKAIDKDKYDFILVNFANCDMVGHTANLEAAIIAAETVDKCVGEVVEKVKLKKGITIVTADHGNAELMLDPKTKQPISTHTTNPVPFILVSDKHRDVKLRNGILADIAPTILELMQIEKPKEMTGNSLIQKSV